MAATIATCIGEDSARTKRATRLGSQHATGRAATWKTFAECTVWRDGHGTIEVRRGKQIVTVTFNDEGSELTATVHATTDTVGRVRDIR